MQADIILISNGPGELAAWVRPVARQLRRELPDARLILALVPCPYASGNEAKTAAGWPENLVVWPPRETVAFLLKPDFTLSNKGVVLFLGGDQFFGLWMSRRTRFPLLTYTESFARWIPWTARFLLSDQHLQAALRRRRIPSSKIPVVGNLMVDAIQPQLDPARMRERLELRTDTPVLSLLPGSKPFKLRYIAPMFLKVAEEIEALRKSSGKPAIQFILHRSPFTPVEQLEAILKDERFRAITGGTGGRLEFEAEGKICWIVTDGGTRIRLVGPEDQYEGMAIADLALTVPGTNTAELAILGIPMVVILPLNKPEEIPLDGLIGRIGELPVLGAKLKRWLIPRLAKGLPFVSLPNQRAKRMLTPETVGVLAPASVAKQTVTLLEDAEERRRIKLDLLQVMGHRGAAEAIAAAVRDQLDIPVSEDLTFAKGKE